MASYSGIGGKMGTSDGKAKAIQTSGGGKSSVVKGGGTPNFAFGPEKGIRNAGAARYDVTNHSLNRSRKMK